MFFDPNDDATTQHVISWRKLEEWIYGLFTRMHRYRKGTDSYSSSSRTLRRTDSPRSSLSCLRSGWQLISKSSDLSRPADILFDKREFTICVTSVYRNIVLFLLTSVHLRFVQDHLHSVFFLSHTISSIVCILICSRYTRSPTYSSTALPQIILTRIPTPSRARKPHSASGHVQRCTSKDLTEYDVVNESVSTTES